MSASLVGSEMCIRDRAEPARDQLEPKRSGRRAGAECSRTGGLGRSGGAVSYTHLTLPTICSV
eukprot:2736347-Alexandrium_andersonii.AAC.1